jgi:hypothetical protein
MSRYEVSSGQERVAKKNTSTYRFSEDLSVAEKLFQGRNPRTFPEREMRVTRLERVKLKGVEYKRSTIRKGAHRVLPIGSDTVSLERLRRYVCCRCETSYANQEDGERIESYCRICRRNTLVVGMSYEEWLTTSRK